MLSQNEILAALDAVKDPEIPVVSIVEMGLIADVQITADLVRVKLTPTFAGCPALDVIRADAEKQLRLLGIEKPVVEMTFDPPWTSERITPEGRRKLKDFGLAPPPTQSPVLDSFIQISFVACPFCNSLNTKLESPFGPTLCRSIHYCYNCQQSFEQFKPV
jgi:ring-1,2-phenylacetyl-CoA epoxidase subunit PaaD